MIARDGTGRLKSITPPPQAPTVIAADFTGYSPETLSRASRTATELGLVRERDPEPAGFLPHGYTPSATARRPHWRRRLTGAGVDALGVVPNGWRGHWPTVSDNVPKVDPKHLPAMMILLASELDAEKTEAARAH
jgi:hypothetical protein